MYGFDSEEEWLGWKSERRKTLIGFIIVGTVVEIDYSVFVSTLYLYLKDLVQTDKPTMWYGVILSLFYTSAIIFAAISGRWVDKTRQIKMYVNLFIIVEVIGLMIYAIPYSPYTLLVGRILCGVGEPFLSVVTGEVLRIYHGEESNVAVMWLALTRGFGFIIGPSLDMIFEPIGFNIGWMRVTRYNFVPMLMIFSLLVIVVMAHFLVSNCSARLDLKEFIDRQQVTYTKGDTNGEGEESKEEINCGERKHLLPQETLQHNTSISITCLLKTLARNFDAAFMFLSTLVLTYTVLSATLFFPLVVIKELKWGVTGVSILWMINGLLILVIYIVLAKNFRSYKAMYYISLVSITAQIVICACFIVFNAVARNLSTDITIMAFLITAITAGWLFEDMFCRIIVAKMVPSQVQCFTEGLRIGLVKLGRILGALSAAFLYDYLTWTSVAFLIIVFAILVVFLARREFLLEPKELMFDTAC